MSARRTVTGKIVDEHLAGSSGEEIELRVDQVLLEDATGTMACLQFDGLSRPPHAQRPEYITRSTVTAAAAEKIGLDMEALLPCPGRGRSSAARPFFYGLSVGVIDPRRKARRLLR